MTVSLRFLREWLRATSLPNWVAKRNVAASYALGEGIGRNGFRARRWYRRTARAGDESPLHDLGMMLLEGESGPVHLPKGRRLLFAAGEAGDPMAEKVLAELFIRGDGFEADLRQQVKWADLARRQEIQV